MGELILMAVVTLVMKVYLSGGDMSFGAIEFVKKIVKIVDGVLLATALICSLFIYKDGYAGVIICITLCFIGIQQQIYFKAFILLEEYILSQKNPVFQPEIPGENGYIFGRLYFEDDEGEEIPMLETLYAMYVGQDPLDMDREYEVSVFIQYGDNGLPSAILCR